jgi:hypothetical protein
MGKRKGQKELGMEIRRKCIRFEVLTAVTMKNAVFWDVMKGCVSARDRVAHIMKCRDQLCRYVTGVEMPCSSLIVKYKLYPM